MEFKQITQELKRMCDFYENCNGCPLYKHPNINTCDSITDLATNNAENLIAEWANTHPVATYRMDFESKFPKRIKGFFEDNALNMCVADFYAGGDCNKVGCIQQKSCKDCWETPMVLSLGD